MKLFQCGLYPEIFSSIKRSDSNFYPWSIVIVAGQPNLDIQPWKEARQIYPAVISVKGTTSGHLLNRSIIVKQYAFPFDVSNRPIKSICIWENLATGKEKVPRSVFVCLYTFKRWQALQFLTHSFTFCLILGYISGCNDI